MLAPLKSHEQAKASRQPVCYNKSVYIQLHRKMRLRSVRCARHGSLNAETYISAQQSQARQDPRIPRAHEEQRRTGRVIPPPGPRPPQTDGQRRKSCPHCQVQLISRSPGRRGSCVPPISVRSMTTVCASPVLYSRPFAWLARTRKVQSAPAWVSPCRVRSVPPSTAIGSSGVSAKPSGSIARNWAGSGTSCSILAAPFSQRRSRKSSEPCGK